MADEKLFGTYSNAAYGIGSYELAYADIAADPNGGTGGNIALSNFVYKDASGFFNNPNPSISAGSFTMRGAGSAFDYMIDLVGDGSSLGVWARGPIQQRAGVTSTNKMGIGCLGSGATISYAYWALDTGAFNSTKGLQLFETKLRPAEDNGMALGEAARRYTTIYAATSTINTSDERKKKEIGPIPDEWLDAWGDVEWSRFKFNDGSRWHIGLVAQRVHAAFERYGLDAFEIGLCCFDEWEEQTVPIFKEKKIKGKNGEPDSLEEVDTGKTEVIQPAGDLWGLRYEECFAIEAAWQRREIARQNERIAQLEAAQ